MEALLDCALEQALSTLKESGTHALHLFRSFLQQTSTESIKFVPLLQGSQALSGTTGSDIASYNRHWTKACGAHGDSDSIPTSTAESYLTAEVAHASAVSRALLHFKASESDTIDKETFQKAAHILYSAVRTAQEQVFANDDMWGDAPPPGSNGKQEEGTHAAEDKQHDWVIGTVAAAHGITPDKDDNNLDKTEANNTTINTLDKNTSTKLTPLNVDATGPNAGSSSPESPGDSAGAVSIGECISAAAGEAPSPGNDDATSSSPLTSEWKAFDTAFTHLSIGSTSQQEDGEESTNQQQNKPPSWTVDMMKHSSQQVSLAEASSKLSTVPGTALHPMPAAERQRCELAFRNKGFERTGGLREPDAQRIFERSQLPASSFRTLWHLANTTGAGALDIRQFCLFVHLLKAAVEEKKTPLPDTISQLQAAQLLGDVPLASTMVFSGGGGSGGGAMTYSSARTGAMVEPLRLDTARLRAVLHHEETPRLHIRALRGRKSINVSGESQYDSDSDEGSSFVDSDEEEEAENEATYGLISEKGGPSPLFQLPQLHGGNATSSKRPGSNGKISVKSAEGSSSNSPFAAAESIPESIPRLALPTAAATSLPTSRLDRAAWEAEAGLGHSSLQLSFRTAALMQKKLLDRPFISLSVRDPVGRLVELPQESHPGLYRNDIGCIDFSNQTLALKTPLRSLPPGCLLFLEVKQWKSDKKRFSTVAWAFVDAEMMIDSGPVCSRVRCGPMVLPLFKKPMDTSLQKLKRLNGKGPGLHMTVSGTVRGVENE